MRRLLGSVLSPVLLTALLATGLGACGDDEGGTVTDDPAPTAGTTPTGDSTPTEDSGSDEVEFQVVDTITETAAGGTLSQAGVPLADDEAVQEFTAQFEADAMTTKVERAVASADVPDDMLLYGAVVAIGCDAPTEMSVTVDGSGVVITANKVPSPLLECFAPMTTVALVLVPASAVS